MFQEGRLQGVGPCLEHGLLQGILQAVKAGRFDRKRLSAFQVRQMRNLHDKALDQLLDQTWGKVNESSAAMKETIARLQKAYQEAPLWAFDGGFAVLQGLSGQGGDGWAQNQDAGLQPCGHPQFTLDWIGAVIGLSFVGLD